jgi:hypothetical protein
MSESPPTNSRANLASRLESLGGALGAREAAHSGDLAEARRQAELLRARVDGALECFHAAATRAGAPDLRIDLSAIRTDDKHLRAVEFDLTRGRHKAIVTARSRGEVTMVGPFSAGKAEGPCQSFPFDATADIDAALGDFLEAFLERAATP